VANKKIKSFKKPRKPQPLKPNRIPSEIVLINLQARLVDVERQIRKVSLEGKDKTGASLKRQRFWEHEQKKCLVSIALFKQRALIPSLERAYEKSKTPEAKRLAKAAYEGRLISSTETQQKRAQGRAMGSGTTSGTWRSEATPTKVPAFVDPEVTALAVLNSARRKCEELETELSALAADDQKWCELVSLCGEGAKVSPTSKPGKPIAALAENDKNHQGHGLDTNTSRIVWNGTARDLAANTLEQYAKGRIHAKSKMAALEQACHHYVGANGKEFKARALWQNLQNRKDEGK
jgi:hypothetical protein